MYTGSESINRKGKSYRKITRVSFCSGFNINKPFIATHNFQEYFAHKKILGREGFGVCAHRGNNGAYRVVYPFSYRSHAKASRQTH